MTDRVSTSIERSWSESEEYEDASLCPTSDQLEMALEELQSHNVTDLENIGEGAFGFVYKGKYEGSVAVVKVSLYKHTKNILKQTPKIQKRLLSNLQRRSSRKSNPDLRQQKNEQQFFTEDHVIHSKKHPELIYHIMEYLPGKDLQEYFEEQANIAEDGKDKKDPLTYTDLMKIFCSLLHAMKFFHEAGIVFNDLKLENVFVDRKYKRVTIIDYIDSSIDCSKLKCNDREDAHIVKTFVDRHTDIPSIAEDIWRIALTILDGIHLLTTGEMADMPANDIQELITLHTYPMDDIATIVNNEMNALRSKFNLDEAAIDELRETLLDMLEENPAKRPDINELLHQPPFDVCLKDKNYLMPKMLQSRRVAKDVAKHLGKEMGETPIVLPKPTAPPKTIPRTPPASHPKRKRSSSTNPTNKTRKKSTFKANTKKRKRASSSRRTKSAVKHKI